MYNDSRIRKWAEVMTTYTAPVREGAHVLIRGTTLAEPLVVELCRAILERGGLPHLRLAPPVRRDGREGRSRRQRAGRPLRH